MSKNISPDLSHWTYDKRFCFLTQTVDPCFHGHTNKYLFDDSILELVRAIRKVSKQYVLWFELTDKEVLHYHAIMSIDDAYAYRKFYNKSYDNCLGNSYLQIIKPGTLENVKEYINNYNDNGKLLPKKHGYYIRNKYLEFVTETQTANAIKPYIKKPKVGGTGEAPPQPSIIERLLWQTPQSSPHGRTEGGTPNTI